MQDTYEEIIFKQLHDAVLKQDKEAVDALRAEDVCVNMHWKRRTVATQLAAKGHASAIHWLINTFDFPLSSAVFAFAEAGNKGEVIGLLKRGASKCRAIAGLAYRDDEEINDFIFQEADFGSALLYDYAFAGKAEKVYELLRRVPNDNNLGFAALEFAYHDMKSDVELLLAWGADLGCVIQGFAMRGNNKAVNQLYQTSDHQKHALVGYITGGYFSLMDALLKQVKSGPWASEFRDFVLCAKFTCARMGYLKRLKKLSEDYPLTSANDQLNDRAELWLPEGLVCGGHSAEFEAWMGQRGNFLSPELREEIITTAILKYAASGYPEKVASLLKNQPAGIEHAIRGFETSAHEQEADDLLKQHSNYLGSALRAAIDARRLDRATHLARQLFDNNQEKEALTIFESALRRTGHYKNKISISRPLLFIKDQEIRAALKLRLLPYPSSVLAREVETIFCIAQQLTKYDLSDFQIYLFLTFKAEWHAWFLQGIQLVEDDKLIRDVFLLISAYVVEMPLKVTKHLLNDYLRIMPQALRDAALDRLKKEPVERKEGWVYSFSGTLFGSQKSSQNEAYKAKEQAIDQACEARMERFAAHRF